MKMKMKIGIMKRTAASPPQAGGAACFRRRPCSNTAMKPLLLAALAALLCAAGCAGTSQPAGGAATVRFTEPQRFTDFIEDGPAPANYERLAGQFAAFIERKGREVVPAGQTLELTVTDVDLAGRMRRGARNLRIVEGTDSAEVRLEYRLVDAGGRVLREGHDTIVRHPSDLDVTSTFDSSGLELIQDGVAAWMRRLTRETALAAR